MGVTSLGFAICLGGKRLRAKLSCEANRKLCQAVPPFKTEEKRKEERQVYATDTSLNCVKCSGVLAI